MRVNSSAWLYTEDTLRKLRESIYFSGIPTKYQSMIRNMIKLLALHDIYYEPSPEESEHCFGTWINTERKTAEAQRRQEDMRRGRNIRPRPAHQVDWRTRRQYQRDDMLRRMTAPPDEPIEPPPMTTSHTAYTVADHDNTYRFVDATEPIGWGLSNANS